jgi:hypothetical protein
MSDFDKIFRDKLNEEDNFPRKEQNWQKLSAQMVAAQALDAQSLPLRHHPQVAWKWAVAATGLLLISSNIWWWFHQNERATLVSAPVVEQKTPDAATIYKTDTIYKIVYRNVEPNKAQNSGNFSKSYKVFDEVSEKILPSVSEPILSKKQAKQLVSKQNLADNTTVFNTTIEIAEGNKLSKKENTPINPSSAPLENKTVKNETPTIVSNEKTESDDAPVLTENTKNEPSKTGEKALNTEGGIQNEKAVAFTENTKNEPSKTGEKPLNTEGGVQNEKAVAFTENTKNELSKTGEKPLNTEGGVQNEKAVALTENTKNEPSKTGENQEKATADIEKEDKKGVTVPAPPIIKPLKWKPQFSIGANALAALPAEKELSTLKGVGITLGARLNKHLRLDIAGFSGGMDYTLKIHKPRWHIPKDPRYKSSGGPPRDSELREIKGRQARQQLALSLTYLFKSSEWLIPKVELAYAVQHIANQSAKFEFRDPMTGKEIHFTEKSTAQTFKNLWSLGFGVEKSFGHFTGDLSITFQKDLSDKSVDMMLLRGGVRYSF